MSVPEYTYLGVDLLTRQVVEELPVYGVSLSRKISAPGNMTASFKLGTGLWSDPDLLSASEPGLRGLLVLRNWQPIWYGPIWSRTYQSQAEVCQLTGQTLESVFAQMEILSLLNFSQVDQTLIFKQLIDRMQSQPSSNFGMDTSGIVASGVLADLVVQTYEHKYYAGPIGDLLKAANSFDYIIDYTFDRNTYTFNIIVKAAYPYLGFGQLGIDVDYPGSITNYYYPESGGKGTVSETVLGQGEGLAMAVGVKQHADLIAAGYPNWARIDSVKSVADPTLLARIAEETARVYKMPVSTPTFELRVDEAIDFNEWSNFGVPFNAHIQDPRFPQGKDLTSRMIGWELSPASSGGPETLKVVLEGDD